MAGNDRDDPLAYGDFHERGPQAGGEDEDYEGGERGIIGDTYRKIRSKYQQPQSNSGSGSGLGASIFNKLQGAVHEIGTELTQRLSGREHGQPGQTQYSVGPEATSQNRYGSFARQQYGNDVKWYVDGCGYMWAVSIAIERARESIWILDCKSISPVRLKALETLERFGLIPAAIGSIMVQAYHLLRCTNFFNSSFCAITRRCNPKISECSSRA